MGEGESVATESPFQSMKAVESTRAKFRTWVSACLGLPKLENMLDDRRKKESSEIQGVEPAKCTLQ